MKVLKLDYKRKIVKSWKEISDVKRNKFECIKVIEYGLVKSTNEKKIKKRKEYLVQAKINKSQEVSDNRIEMFKLSEKKRNNFFVKTEQMKRKRDENEQDERIYKEKKLVGTKEDNPTGETRLARSPSLVEDNLANEPRSSLLEQASGEKKSLSNLTSCPNKIQVGNSKQNFNKLKSIFENEADSQKLNVRGQCSCLAKPANRIKGDKIKTNQPSPDRALGNWKVLGEKNREI